MIKSLQIVSWFSLVVLVAPSILFFMEKMPLAMVHTLMNIATIIWFASRMGVYLLTKNMEK